MLNKVLLTPIDLLVEYVKEHNNCAVTKMKAHLEIQQDILERWLTVLEEVGVVKVRYKGLEAFVEYVEQQKIEDKTPDVEMIKELFIDKCKKKDLSYDKIKSIWPLFVEENNVELKKVFARKAKTEGYDMAKLDSAWQKYKKDLVRI